jgi:hypothetical protein
MNNFFRTIIAAWGAKKLGGGCFSTIIIFIVIYTLLGKCGNQQQRASAKALPAKVQMARKF